MPNDLKKLRVNEVSLVDAGANAGSVSVLMKRAGADVKEWIQKIAVILGLSSKEIAKINEEVSGMPKPIEEVVKELEARVEKSEKAQATSDSITKISIALSKAAVRKDYSDQEAEIAKLDTTDPRVPVLKEMVARGLKKAALHDRYAILLSDVEKAEFDALPMAKKDAYMAKKPKKGASPSDSSADSSSSDDSSAADSSKDDDGVSKRLAEEIKKNADMRVRLEKMERTEAIAKIKSEDLKGVEKAAKLDDLAEAVFKLRRLDADSVNVVVSTLKSLAAQNEAAQKIITQEIGKGTPIEGSAEQKLESLAKAKAEKDHISFDKAYAQILDTADGQELYKQFEAEKKSK